MKYVLNPKTLDLKQEFRPLRCCIFEPIDSEKVRQLPRWATGKECPRTSWTSGYKLIFKPSIRLRVVGAPSKCSAHLPFRNGFTGGSIKDKPLRGRELLGFEFEILREHLVESMHPNDFTESKKMVFLNGYEYLGVNK